MLLMEIGNLPVHLADSQLPDRSCISVSLDLAGVEVACNFDGTLETVSEELSTKKALTILYVKQCVVLTTYSYFLLVKY